MAFAVSFTTAKKQLKPDQKETQKSGSGGEMEATSTADEETEEDDDIDPFLIKMFQFLLSVSISGENLCAFQK